MQHYFIEPRTRKCVEGYEFLSFSRNLSNKYGIINASEKVIDTAGEFLGNKIADAVTNSHNNKIVQTKPVEDIIIPPEKREEILNKLRQVS